MKTKKKFAGFNKSQLCNLVSFYRLATIQEMYKYAPEAINNKMMSSGCVPTPYIIKDKGKLVKIEKHTTHYVNHIYCISCGKYVIKCRHNKKRVKKTNIESVFHFSKDGCIVSTTDYVMEMGLNGRNIIKL